MMIEQGHIHGLYYIGDMIEHGSVFRSSWMVVEFARRPFKFHISSYLNSAIEFTFFLYSNIFFY